MATVDRELRSRDHEIHEGQERADIRSCMPRVGNEDYLLQNQPIHQSKRAQFDEPTLGIIGMWRLGAGANPHFALALGEIMLRVGQRYLAWAAYERGYQMRDLIWPNSDIQEAFGRHCRTRQEVIERELPEEDWAAVRDRFDKELRIGRQYQADYQDYERRRLAEGHSTEEKEFYADFERDHGDIGTPVGAEDSAWAVEKVESRSSYPLRILLAGVLTLLASAAQFISGRNKLGGSGL